MKAESFKANDTHKGDKTPYEKPIIQDLDQAFGLIVMGDSNIIDDEDHEYSPDND